MNPTVSAATSMVSGWVLYFKGSRNRRLPAFGVQRIQWGLNSTGTKRRSQILPLNHEPPTLNTLTLNPTRAYIFYSMRFFGMHGLGLNYSPVPSR